MEKVNDLTNVVYALNSDQHDQKERFVEKNKKHEKFVL